MSSHYLESLLADLLKCELRIVESEMRVTLQRMRIEEKRAYGLKTAKSEGFLVCLLSSLACHNECRRAILEQMKVESLASRRPKYSFT